MGCTKSIVSFLAEQLGPDVVAKAMFGEYGLYAGGILFGLVCDDRLFVKDTAKGRALVDGFELAPPYPSAKPAIVVPEDVWDDRTLMRRLVQTTVGELSKR